MGVKDTFRKGGYLWQRWAHEGKDGLKFHREGGPALIQHTEDGKTLLRKQWFRYGKLHREDGPALEKYYRTGPLKLRRWLRNNKMYSDPGCPTVQKFRQDGTLSVEEYLEHPNIKACIYYGDGVTLHKEVWYNDRYQHHREDGPAITEYNKEHTSQNKSYYLHDEEIDFVDFFRYLDDPDLKKKTLLDI